jgi:hypothetical protein
MTAHAHCLQRSTQALQGQALQGGTPEANAYRAKVQKYHPDRVNSLATDFQELADRKMKEINQAYELACRIKRPTSRR